MDELQTGPQASPNSGDFNAKRWFIYVVDHHEGPFSLAEIQVKLFEKQTTPEAYVWCEGMADWSQMTEVAEFAPLREQLKAASEEGKAEAQPEQVPEPKIESEPSPSAEVLSIPVAEAAEVAAAPTASEPDLTSDLDAADLKQAQMSDRSAAPKGFSKGFKLTLAGVVIVGLAAATYLGAFKPVTQAISDSVQPKLFVLVDRVPALGRWISPIPHFDDISSGDWESLRAAAIAPGASLTSSVAPPVGIALSTSDLLTPSFYVTSHLPDGTQLEVTLEGISETLLNQVSARAKASAVLDRRLGKAVSLRTLDGKPLPRGEYVVYVTEAALQPDTTATLLANIAPVTTKLPANLPTGIKLLASKTYFLGGAKDEKYEAQLKEYHQKLQAKAVTELTELKQFYTTLDAQLDSTASVFAKAGPNPKKPGSAPKKAWFTFHKEWSKMAEQLHQSFDRWTPETLSKEYFYTSLYSLTREAGLSVEGVHQLQTARADKKMDQKEFELKIGSAMSLAQGALNQLKSKIEQAEKLSPTANGMPRRDGL